MLLGPKFYTRLERLTVWRHSLFALVLATRQYPQFALWTEINDKQGKAQYLHALKQCWEYHYDKFNHIDLTAAWEQLEPFLPLELEEYSEGDSFAFDTAVMINAALDCIPLNSKEGKEASNASMASAIRLCELRHPEQAQDEESLLELPEIEAELDYQVELLELVSKPRSGENIKALLELALRDHCSGIGLENPLTVEDFASCFTAHYESRTPEDDNYDPRELVAEPKSASDPRRKADAADSDNDVAAQSDDEEEESGSALVNTLFQAMLNNPNLRTFLPEELQGLSADDDATSTVDADTATALQSRGAPIREKTNALFESLDEVSKQNLAAQGQKAAEEAPEAVAAAHQQATPDKSAAAFPDADNVGQKMAAYMQRFQDEGLDDEAVKEAAATAVFNETIEAAIHQGLRDLVAMGFLADDGDAADSATNKDNATSAPTAKEQDQRASATPSAADVYGQGPKSHGNHHKGKHHGADKAKAKDKSKAKGSAHKEHGHHHHHHHETHQSHGHKDHHHHHKDKDKS